MEILEIYNTVKHFLDMKVKYLIILLLSFNTIYPIILHKFKIINIFGESSKIHEILTFILWIISVLILCFIGYNELLKVIDIIYNNWELKL